MKSPTHPDVEYAAGDGYFDDYSLACLAAIEEALQRGRATHDVIIHSRKGARWYGGDEAVEMYDEDPEASVFERIEVRANNLGRVP